MKMFKKICGFDYLLISKNKLNTTKFCASQKDNWFIW